MSIASLGSRLSKTRRALVIIFLTSVLAVFSLSYFFFQQKIKKQLIIEQYPVSPVERISMKRYSINLSGLKNSLNQLEQIKIGNTIYLKIPEIEKKSVSISQNNRVLGLNKNNYNKTQVGSPSDPFIPAFSFRVLLPSNVDKESVRIEESTFSGQTSKILEKDLMPIPIPVTYDENFQQISPLTGQNFVDGRNTNIYNQNRLIPSGNIDQVKISEKGHLKFAVINIYPYQYNPFLKTLALTTGIDFKLKFSIPTARSDRPRLKRREQELLQNFVNNEETDESYDTGSGEGGNLPGIYLQEQTNIENTQEMPEIYRQEPAGTPDGYAIITTSSIVANSQKFNAFVTHKRGLGYQVYVVTETQWGSGSMPAASERANKIRQWLKANYQNLKLDYVLLIGNPDPYNPKDTGGSVGDIPMIGCWLGLLNDPVPTDYYFAELTGNWDKDGDKLYCEYPDDAGTGGVEFSTEVFVGRIAVYNNDYVALDSILNKIIRYETDNGDISWRRKVLLPMNPLGGTHYGWRLGEELKTVFQSAGFRTYRIYDGNYKNDDGVSTNPDLTPLTYTNAQATWNGSNGRFVNPVGVGLLISSSHGNKKTLSDVVTADDLSQINDNYPTINFHGSCFNADPEVGDNLAYSLIKKGVINIVATTRNGFYVPDANNLCGGADTIGNDTTYNEQLACRFGIYMSQGKSVGEAFDMLRETSQITDAYNWFNLFSYNLFGDPSINPLKNPTTYPTSTLVPSPILSPSPTFAVTPTSVISSGLVAYLKFNEGQGFTTSDSSNNGNSGTLVNGPSWTDGRVGKALRFDGVDDYVDVGKKAILNNLTSFTWSAWIYPRSWGEGGFGRIIGKTTDSGHEKTLYLGNNGTLRFYFFASTTNASAFSNTNTVVLNSWQHVAVTFNSQTDKKPHLYLNGNEVSYSSQTAQSGTPWNDTNYNLLIGNRKAQDRTFDGIIDEVRVYNRILNPEEILTLMHVDPSATSIPTPTSVPTLTAIPTSVRLTPTSSLIGLRSLWKFDEGQGNIAYDSSNYGYNGTLINNPLWSTGRVGTALKFNGSNSYVAVYNNLGISDYSRSPFTVAMWVKASSNQIDKRIFSIGNSESNYPLFTLGTDSSGSSGKIDIFVRNDANTTLLNHKKSTLNAFDDNWHHVVLTADNGTIKLYIDGKLDPVNFNYTPSGSFTANRVGIGAILRASASYIFNGYIDEVYVFNRVLTTSEIQTLYSSP